MMAIRRICTVLGLLLVAGIAAGREPLVRFDFTKPEDCRGWVAAHDIASLRPAHDGLAVGISGIDPYIHGPSRDYPANQPLWLRLRFKSDQAGAGQVFWYGARPAPASPREEDSIRFEAQAGWNDLRVPLPPLGAGCRLRIDPPGSGGIVVLALLEIELRTILKEPVWLAPVREAGHAQPTIISSGKLRLEIRTGELGGFDVKIADRQMAIGHNRPLIGYVVDDQQRWLDLARRSRVSEVASDKQSLELRAEATDEDGAQWRITQRFSPATPDAIDVETEVTVDKDRQVVFLPMLGLCAGVADRGEMSVPRKALFPGVEYLDEADLSSSEADIVGPGAKRQVPDSLKITMPMMVLAAGGQYVGLMWEPAADVCALFDSPDRVFKSGGHAMALIYPGANANNRVDGSVLPHAPTLLRANQPIKLKATIIGGIGDSVVPAIQQYVATHKLPPVPNTHLDRQDYAKLAAAGWLDSKVREANRFRHAYPGSFQPQPAADAAVWMQWLMHRGGLAPALQSRLLEASKAALAEVNPARMNSASVSHVRYPVASLLYGNVVDNARMARDQGRALLSRFEPDGTVLYKPSGAADYGRTHFAKDANGLTAQLVMTVLEAATVSGDATLTAEGLRLLRAMDKFANSAPRGAQTWECPLHTPDILASAHLVRAYTMGYELSGEAHFLEMARYWAWTGVPFVYLVNPAGREVGPYATIAVYGATNWQAPNWMGLPVQWCGLVYADALYRFEKYDSKGPWRQLADGITASGIQQTFPIDNPERRGLLPDSFSLRAAVRNDPGINPGTVQANAVRLYRQPEVYSFHSFRMAGLLVHAPADLAIVQEKRDVVSFKVSGCMQESYSVLVAGVRKLPSIRINGRPAQPGQFEYARQDGWLVLRLKGDSTIDLAVQ